MKSKTTSQQIAEFKYAFINFVDIIIVQLKSDLDYIGYSILRPLVWVMVKFAKCVGGHA